MDCFTSFAMTGLSNSGDILWRNRFAFHPTLGGDALSCAPKTTAPTLRIEAVPHQTSEVFFASFFFRKKKTLLT
jgi:hypothetical protein